MKIDAALKPISLRAKIDRLFDLSAQKILALEESWDPGRGTPVFTVAGKYTSRAWTEWTQGFRYGSALLQFDATGDRVFLDIGRRWTLQRMAPHITHIGVHDHGFNNISTYGNLRRLIREGRIPGGESLLPWCELALKVSGAVQAARWTQTCDGKGYIYSFNGPHSLFADTIRTLRVLALAHHLGHVLMGEGDKTISLLQRLLFHSQTTARYNVYYGEGRDAYDVRGRVAHESLFNPNNGCYHCPSTQQGYSPFTTWTRGLAWIITGYAEQLEFFATLSEEELAPYGGRIEATAHMLRAVEASADYYMASSAADGIPYWDTGAPGLIHLGDITQKPADPYNEYEPVDSSAAAIAAQGLIRLGRYLYQRKQTRAAQRYYQAGLTIANTLLDEPYLSQDPNHQGLLLHSIYHRPKGWDHVPEGSRVPNGESSLWGDYHARELALLLLREIEGKAYLTFF